MKVSLINYTNNPDLTVATAARQCYSPDDPVNILSKCQDNPGTQKDFIQKIAKMGHLSPFEHASFTFAISGISRACSHQLVRHRIASYSQKSQRYVSEDQFEYVVPPSIKALEKSNPDAAKEYKSIMSELQTKYNFLVNKGIPKEDARYLLPNACCTSIVVTMNARSLLNFFAHRCCTRAQWEIRQMANLMLKEVKKVAPDIFVNAGANCEILGYCPEGKMSCGRYPTLDQYNKVSTKDKEE